MENTTISIRTEGSHGADALGELRTQLEGATVGEPDETGVADVELEAADRGDAVRRVVDAIAATGSDEHLVVIEHSDEQGHWHRPGRGTTDPGGALG